MRHELAEIQDVISTVIEDTGDVIRWQWDDYIGAMLTKFELDQVKQVFTALDNAFSSIWDSESIGSAPESVKAIAESSGGVRQSQYLFVTAPDEPFVAYAAWWPWGDWETISVRIGLLLPRDIDDYLADHLMQEFCGFFRAVAV